MSKPKTHPRDRHKPHREEIKPGAVYTSEEAARLLHVGINLLKAAAKKGELPFSRPGKAFLFRGAALLAWQIAREQERAQTTLTH